MRVGFHHRLERNRDLAVEERTLKVYIRNMGANDPEFSERQSEVAELLPVTAGITGNKRNVMVASYDIEAASPTSFFAAHVRALKTAIVDLVVDNEEPSALIDDRCVEAIRQTYGVSID